MKILLTGAFNYSKENIKSIEGLGFDITFVQYEKDKVENPAQYDAVVCNGLFLYNDIKEFSNLKYIQLTSAGYDRVPMDYVLKQGIEIRNARGVYSIPMAEWAVLKILEIYKDSKGFYIKHAEKKWDKNRSLLELYDKNALIIGCGNIGTEIAKRLNVFGVNVVGVDIAEFESEYFSKISSFSELDKALSCADIVILTAPLTEQTKYMINAETILSIKDNTVLINLSRGDLINELDLIDAIENNKFLGVALDVFETEPLEKNSRLWDMDNVIITPHNSFVGEGNQHRMFDVMFKNMKEWLSGK